LQQIFAVLNHVHGLGVPDQFFGWDHTLARGLDYYAGPIVESDLPELSHIGSLSGGGRYDGLVGIFSMETVPATGTIIGLDRIQTALTQLGKFESAGSTTQVLIIRFDEDGMAFGLELAAELRKNGIRTEVWNDDDRVKKQFAYADKQGFSLVVIAGSDERNRGTVAVKTMKTAEQKEIPRSSAVETIRSLLRAL